MPKTIAVVSIKGGVGKTTTSINLAAYIAAMGIELLLVDLDPQNGCMYGMGLDSGDGPCLKDVILHDVSATDALTPTNHPNLRVMMCGQFADGEELEAFVAALERDPYRLKSVLGRVVADSPFSPELILIDGPAGLGPATVNAVAASDSIILPVQCEPLSLRTLPQMLRTVVSIQARYNPALKVEGILTTMYDPRQEARFGVARQVWNEFPDSLVFETVIPRHEQLVESFAVGAPAVDISARSPGAQAYIQLGRELIMRLPEPETTFGKRRSALGSRQAAV